MEITANALQTVAENQNVLFTDTPVAGSCSILHREGSGLVTLRGLTNQCRARFKVIFGANIAIPAGGAAGPISLALAISGEPVATTTMTVTPAAVEEFFNIGSSIYLDVPRCTSMTIAVQNISDQEVDVQNANLIIERIA